MTAKKKIITKIDNSIQPSINEIERFICHLNKKFKLELPNNIIVNIQDAHKNIKGYFRPSKNPKHYENKKQKLHQICISSIHLRDTPYETIAHETAHFYNESKEIKDCSSNQYHNKHFKTVAEKILLKVERGKRGFAYTKETPEFKIMLKTFKPNKNAFTLFQHTQDKKKIPNRNLLYICFCGVKVRTARNQEKPFKGMCQYCHTTFKLRE